MDKQKKTNRQPRNRLEEYAMIMDDLEQKQKQSEILFDRSVVTEIMLNEINKTLAMIFDLMAMSYNLFLAPMVKEEKPQ